VLERTAMACLPPPRFVIGNWLRRRFLRRAARHGS